MIKLTIGAYAKKLGLSRDTIHKRMKRKEKLIAVTKIERAGEVYILHVNEAKLPEPKKKKEAIN